MTTKTKPAEVEHLDGCPAVGGERLERYTNTDGDGRPVGVTRCNQCGSATYSRTNATVPTDAAGRSETAAGLLAGDERYQDLWHTDPSALYRGLTPDERRDPKLNPLHQFAESEAPGVRSRRILE